MAKLTTITQAVGTLTSSGVFTDTQTVVVGSKTYTTQTALTNVDGNVLIGASAAATLQNLFDAINLSGTAGTQYATAMTPNKQVLATAVDTTTLTVKAKIGGTEGNLVPSTETQTNASWGGAVLASGAGDAGLALQEIRTQCQVNAELLHMLSLIDGRS